jgi:predicted transposase YdaD
LGDIRQLPVWVGLMVLTTLDDEQATQEARYLLTRNQQEESQAGNRAIIELITTIMVYKFENKSRIQVEEMLGITLQETRVYREIKEEGIQEGEQRENLKRDGISHDVSMRPCTNPLILIMGISLLPVARSLFPFKGFWLMF